MYQSKIPKVLSTMQDIKNPQTIILKNEMKKFMNNIQQQFDNVIAGYEKQFSRLEKQKSKLSQKQNQKNSKMMNSTAPCKNNNYKTQTKRSLRNVNQSYEIDDIQQWMLPLKSNDFNLSTSSPFYRTARRSSKDPTQPWGSVIKTHDSSPLILRKALSFSMQHNQKANHPIKNQITNHNNLNQSTSINIPPNQRSQYERRSQIKKQRQEEIVHCLQSHKKNLNEITYKMMGMIGRSGQQKDEEETNDFQQLESQNQSINPKNRSQSRLQQQQDHHNRSLSNICDSLDKSFVSQQTRKAKLKKKLIEQETKKKNQQKEIKNQQVRKQRAIKNLLSRLRENALSIQPPQTVKGSKLLSVGNNNFISNNNIPLQLSRLPVRRNSKVLINPVPVNAPLKTRKNQHSPSFIEKRPTSILKQSSNVLTRSISGISAIAFDE